MANFVHSATFKANAEGFKKWNQPDWELLFWLPIYDKRFGKITYSGLSKIDINTATFKSARIQDLEFNTTGVADLEGRAILAGSYDVNNNWNPQWTYSIVSNDSSVDNYPNKPSNSSVIPMMNSYCTFTNGLGKYNIQSFSNMFRVENGREVSIGNTSDVIVNSAREYSLNISGRMGDFVFNKCAIFITNRVTKENFLFGVLYFNTNITKRIPASSSLDIPDVKFKFKVMLSASTDSNPNRLDVDMDNYVVFGNGGDLIPIGGDLLYTDKSIVIGGNFEDDLQDTDVRNELRKYQVAFWQDNNAQGTFVEFTKNGSNYIGGFNSLRTGLSGDSLFSIKTNKTYKTDGTSRKSLFNDIVSDNIDDDLSWVETKASKSFGNRVRSVLPYTFYKTEANITDAITNMGLGYAKGLRFTNLTNSDVMGHDAVVRNSSGIIGYLYGSYNGKTYAQVTEADVDPTSSSLWLADVNYSSDSIVHGYNIKGRFIGSDAIGSSFNATAKQSSLRAYCSAFDSIDLIEESDVRSRESYISTALQGASNGVPEFGEFMSNDIHSVRSMLFGNIVRGSQLDTFNSMLNGSAIDSLIGAEWSTISGEVKHSTIKAEASSISGADQSDVNADSSVIDGSFNSDIFAKGIAKGIVSNLVAKTKVVGTSANIGYGRVVQTDASTNDAVRTITDRFVYLSAMNLKLSDFGVTRDNYTGQLVFGSDQYNGSFGDFVASDTKGVVSQIANGGVCHGNWFYYTSLGGANAPADNTNLFKLQSYYIPAFTTIDISSSGVMYADQDAQDYRSVYYLKSIESALASTTYVGVSARLDLPLSVFGYMSYGSTEASNDIVSVGSNSVEIEEQGSVSSGATANLFLYDLVQNMDYDLVEFKNVVGSAYRFNKLDSITYNDTTKQSTIHFPYTYNISAWDIAQGAVTTLSDSNPPNISALGLKENALITLAVDNRTAGSYSADLMTMKIVSSSSNSGGTTIIVEGINGESDYEMLKSILSAYSATKPTNAVVWSVDNDTLTTMKKYYSQLKKPSSYVNRYISTRNDLGIGRVCRYSFLKTYTSDIISDESYYGLAEGSQVNLVSSSVTRTFNSVINTEFSVLPQTENSMVIGTNIRVNPVNALNTIVYKYNGVTSFASVKNAMQDSILFGSQINLNILPMTKHWLGDYSNGSLINLTSANSVKAYLEEARSRIKNVYIFGDSIHTMSGIYDFQAGYDLGLNSGFIQNSGRSDVSADNKKFMPITGLRDSFIRGREITLASSSGILEEVNLFGRYLNAEHSWINVFGRYNEWFSREIENLVGRDFFVIANGMSHQRGGGIFNTGKYIDTIPTLAEYNNGYRQRVTRRYNMFVVTDRGVTKARTLVKNGTLFRCNPNYLLQQAYMKEDYSAGNLTDIGTPYWYGITSSATDLITDWSNSSSSWQTYAVYFPASGDSGDSTTPWRSTRPIFIPNVLRPILDDDTQLSDDVNYFGLSSDDQGFSNFITDGNLASYDQGRQTNLKRLFKLTGILGTSVESINESASSLYHSVLTDQSVSMMGIKLKNEGMYSLNLSLNGLVSNGTNGNKATLNIKSVRIFMWENGKNATIQSNGDVYLDSPVVVFNYNGSTFKLTESVKFMVQNTNSEVWFSMTINYDESATTWTGFDNNTLGEGFSNIKSWRDGFLTLSYDGYMRDGSVWNNYIDLPDFQ